VVGGGGADTMLQFRLEMEGGGTKRCRKMKWRHRAHLASMGRKRERRDSVATSTGGEATPERGKRGDNASWADANLTGPKNKENSRGRFSCYKWTVNI
jgi:hypothetical protein